MSGRPSKVASLSGRRPRTMKLTRIVAIAATVIAALFTVGSTSAAGAQHDTATQVVQYDSMAGGADRGGPRPQSDWPWPC